MWNKLDLCVVEPCINFDYTCLEFFFSQIDGTFLFRFYYADYFVNELSEEPFDITKPLLEFVNHHSQMSDNPVKYLPES